MVSTPIPHHAQRRLLLLIGDLLASNVALFATVLWRGWWEEPGNASPLWWFISLTVLALVVARVSDSDNVGVAANPYAGSFASGRAGLITTAAYFFLPYISAPLPHSRSAAIIFLWGTLILRIIWRSSYALVIRQPRFATRLIIVGRGRSAQSLVDAVRTNAGDDHRIIGCLTDDQDDEAFTKQKIPILSGPEALDDLVSRGEVTLIVLALPGSMSSVLSASVIRAYESGVRVLHLSPYYEALTGRVPIEHVGENWVFAVPSIQAEWIRSFVKRLIDIIGAVAGLALTVVLILPIAVAVRLSGQGPILYGQIRVGERGRLFRVRKFRSMETDAEPMGEAVWATVHDPRVTKIGRWLRASRLDELPQFWNVLRGEMSLVGPRPERPEFIARLQQSIPFYRSRLLVRPGVTGWAQVKQDYASSAEDALVKLQYDLYYINHQSIYLDILILLKTIVVVLRLRGR